MISKEKCHSILSECLKLSRADETLITLSGGKEHLTRFANNYIHQNVVKKDYTITVQSIYGQKIGKATTNVFLKDDLERVCRESESIAQMMPDNPKFSGLVELKKGESYQDVPLSYVEETAEVDPLEKAKVINDIVTPLKNKNLTGAGADSTGDGLFAIMNSKDIFAFHTETFSDFTLSVMTPDGGSGWSEFHCNNHQLIDPKRLYNQAYEKAILSQNPQSIEPGEYTVIFEPTATTTFLMFLGYLGLSGLGYAEQRSCLNGQLGKKVVGSNVTLIDDFTSSATLGMPFDVEGTPRQKLTLIENGVLQTIPHGVADSRISGLTNTGHSCGFSHGGYPQNINMKAGDITSQDIIKNAENAILVTRTWYDNVVNPKTAKITGMTRDGTFFVKNGKITGAIKNLRYNEEVLKVLNNIEAISSETRQLDSLGKMSVPMIKVNNFHITGCTA